MPNVSCREDLKGYALRALGAPALQINVTQDQIDDRIDDALASYWEWHHEGSYLDFVSHQLTQTDIDTKSFTVDPWVYQVLRIMMLGSAYGEYNLEYTAFMQGMGAQTITTGQGIVSYVVQQSYLSLVRDFFSPQHRIAFNQNHDKIFIHSDWGGLKVGDYLVLECYRFSDPDAYRHTWNDAWLKAMATALIKRQWGQNMLKYSGFQMPSGITLNGRDIFSDATQEIAELMTQLYTTETTPPDFFIG